MNEIAANISNRVAGEMWTLNNTLGIHIWHQHVCPTHLLDIEYFNRSQALGNVLGWEELLPALKYSMERRPMTDTFLILRGMKMKLFQNYSCCDGFCQGKTLVHCHIGNHDDTGMMKAVMIRGDERRGGDEL